jgi:hypothetical protein
MTDPKEIKLMKARILLMENSMRGLEELVIQLLERNDAERRQNVTWGKSLPSIPQA